MKRGQMNFVFLAVGIVIGLIALIMAQQVVTNSIGNFTAGSLERTAIGFIVPLMAIGLLVVVVASAIGRA